jgi:hypothetical protein
MITFNFVTAPEDVLLEIFSYLEVKDLVSCEEAYDTWRSALTSEAFWKRKFQRNVKSIPEWRKIWRKLNEHEKLVDVSYRSKCHVVLGNIEVNFQFQFMV